MSYLLVASSHKSGVLTSEAEKVAEEMIRECKSRLGLLDHEININKVIVPVWGACGLLSTKDNRISDIFVNVQPKRKEGERK